MHLFYKLQSLLIVTFALCFPLKSLAVYCTPTVNTSGIYLNFISFAVPNVGFTGGIAYSTGSGGFTQTVGSSSGTTNRYFGGGIYYGIYNPTASSKAFDLGFYIDWNNDTDFDDVGEAQPYPISGSVPAMTSSTTGFNIFPPLGTPPGNYRIRIAISQSGTGTPAACGAFTGEVEDYIFTIANNTAPVLKTSATPILNNLLNSQTNSNGLSINEIIGSAEPTDTLIKDANDMSANFGSSVPKGIAIYGQTATNGTWQYKIGTGSWTAFGALTTSNALLLMADASRTDYQPKTRLRFVPTGNGTPTISFKAYDGITGTNGSYAAVTTNGGTTAFSAANTTATLNVIANNNFNNNIYFASYSDGINSASMNRQNGLIANPEPILANTISTNSAVDIELEATSNRLFWLLGSQDSIVSATTAGGSLQTIATGLNYSTGLTSGNGKIYYSTFSGDFTAFNIMKVKTDGTGSTLVYTSATITDSKDIEFYKNKLYLQYGDATGYHIGTIDTLGAGFTLLYTSSAGSYFSSMSIANDTLFWTETNGTIKKRAIANATVTQIFSAPRYMNDLIIDPATSTVYFTDNDINSNDKYTNIRKIVTTGGAATTINTVNGYLYGLTFLNTPTLPLPIGLLTFTGRYNDKNSTATLNWSTAFEHDNASFVLERSQDGNKFETIATVKSTGNSATTTKYSYDDDVADVNAGTLYYRLQQLEKDGKGTYSNVVVLQKGKKPMEISVWPNPGKGYFNVHLNNVIGNQSTMKIFSSDGRLVTSSLVNSSDFQIDLTKNKAGIYFVQFDFDNGIQQHFTIVNE